MTAFRKAGGKNKTTAYDTASGNASGSSVTINIDVVEGGAVFICAACENANGLQSSDITETSQDTANGMTVATYAEINSATEPNKSYTIQQTSGSDRMAVCAVSFNG